MLLTVYLTVFTKNGVELCKRVKMKYGLIDTMPLTTTKWAIFIRLILLDRNASLTTKTGIVGNLANVLFFKNICSINLTCGDTNAS